MTYDYLIVGAGFAGSVCARQLADAGKRVLVIDKRDHIGGNAYDYVNEHGVRIHKYGPHIFHTNSDKVFAYLSRFTEWRPYEHRVLAAVHGKLVPFPINLTTLEMLYGREFDEDSARALISNDVPMEFRAGDKAILTAEDQCLATVGRELYELFFKGYTTKMWGVTPDKLDKSVTARIPIRFNRDDRYFTDKHQAMPKDGYTAMFERMLDHPGIEVRLRDHLFHASFECETAPIIWTGPIDEYFDHCFGPLPYRSMAFRLSHGKQFTTMYGDVTTLNFPDPTLPWTRGTDMGKLTDTRQLSSCLVEERPTDEGDPYYPIPAPENRALYKQYEALAAAETNVTFLGRLGSYAYYNMDQCVGQALMVSERLLGANPAR